MPSSELDLSNLPDTLTQLLADVGMAASGKQVKDALARHAVVVNGAALSLDANAQLESVFDAAKALHERFFLVRLSRRNITCSALFRSRSILSGDGQ